MEKTLREQLEELDERVSGMEGLKNAPKQSFKDKLLGKKKAEKEFPVPKEIKRGSKKKLKDNYCVVVYVRSNKSVEISWCPIVDDAVYVKQTDIYHTGIGDCVLQYKKYPMLIIPEWNLSPINNKPTAWNPKEDVEGIMQGKGYSSYPQKVLVHLLKKQALAIKDKKKMGGKAVLVAIIVIGVIIYAATKLIK